MTQKWKFDLGRVKTLREKEKMLVTSIFSFSHNVFKRLLFQGCLKSKLCGKELTHYHTMSHFDALKIYIAVENIVRKGEIACSRQFLLFSQCFPLYMALACHFKCTLKFRLQFVSLWASLKFCCQVMG